MFQTKKQKIKQYLEEQRKNERMSDFDLLLEEQIRGTMEKRLGLETADFHIDWMKEYRCIQIQGKHGPWYVDIQIEPGEFFVDIALDEPDDVVCYPLESTEQFYKIVQQRLNRTP